MNNIYIYQNNFFSLLSLIKILYDNKIKPYNIKKTNYIGNLFENLVFLKTDNNKDIIKIFKRILGKENYKMIYYVYLSNDDNKELIIYYYIINCLKYQNITKYKRNLKCVNEALRISNYVSRENHKFKGFLRFKELKNNILYAEINPENNILGLLSNHFKERLKNECWIIKDVNRGIISLYDKKKYYLVNADIFDLLDINYSANEFLIEDLWKKFYKTIGIESRKNDRCRINFMPKKYWKYIIEVSDEYEEGN